MCQVCGSFVSRSHRVDSASGESKEVKKLSFVNANEDVGEFRGGARGSTAQLLRLDFRVFVRIHVIASTG